MKLTDSLSCIKGIGDKTEKSFSRLNINNINDLLHYYPRTYITYEEPVDICELNSGSRQAVYVTINSRPEVRKIKGLTITTVYAKDYSGTIKLTWFNCPFLRNYFHIGSSFIFVGEVSLKNGMLNMTQPEYYEKDKYSQMLSVWQPVYTCTSGISNKTIQKAVKNAAEVINSIEDYLPDEARREYDIESINDAVYNIHFPKNECELKRAIKRMAFDEFYEFISNMNRLKQQNEYQENQVFIPWDKRVTDFIESLPYRLTDAQMDAVRDIMKDMSSDYVMNRLVQGDVGSGKTIVAAIALYACVCAGYQGALMAPTEVLAAQHYKDFVQMFEPYGVKVVLLSGSMTAKEKRLAYEEIADHNADIIIGTHAIIQDKVMYDNLGLVVTDEQHRFGVRQREKLSLKGCHPHVLVMSATPIPRTLAIIMYGDLDISVINQLPEGRIPIKNCVVDGSYRTKAHRFIISEVNKGHQVYIVCPMVAASETMDDVANVVEYTEELKKQIGDGISVAYLHGKMSGDEKNNILNDFASGLIKILVSTTVIEVGINNPNATVMMVENAERFGLAQLHQLRGRVGRGNLQSYCIFISGKNDRETMDRLDVLARSNDGFYIAGEDLKRRGPGDFFGIRQSGEMLFKIGDIYNHADMLKAAQDIYKKYGQTINEKGIFADASHGTELYNKPIL
ncbi:MAG: ATP-dependent DNA helicase RecG [Coprococcus sp.]